MSALSRKLRERGVSGALEDVVEFINRELVPAYVELQNVAQGRWGVLATADDTDGSYKVQLGDEFVKIDTASAAFVVSLPAASDYPVGKVLRIKKTDTGQLIVAPDGSDTIDESVSGPVVSASYGMSQLYSDGTEWWTLQV